MAQEPAEAVISGVTVPASPSPGATGAITGNSPRRPASATPTGSDFLDRPAEDMWVYLSSDWATANHLPWRWCSEEIGGGDFANTAEMGHYALSWPTTHDLLRAWTEIEAEVIAVLDQLRA